jgi:hypothetical protein
MARCSIHSAQRLVGIVIEALLLLLLLRYVVGSSISATT